MEVMGPVKGRRMEVAAEGKQGTGGDGLRGMLENVALGIEERQTEMERIAKDIKDRRAELEEV
jgi:hypothetical protein